MNNFDVLLGMKLGGGGGSSTLVSKTITANGTYNPADDNADGYSSVTANVPNTYDLGDEGKVVDNGALVSQTSRQITSNNTYNTTLNNEVVVNVPNTYDLADEGKVVSSGALVSQSSRNIDANGLYDTTLNNSMSVDVPNSYTASDEGKVVSSGALVSQSAYPSTIVTNGTYDTTLNNSVTVDVPPVGVVVEKDVNFYDYDGTLLYSYTAQEFLALTELPAMPTHTGLTIHWNWSLSDAKTYVTDYGKLDIGIYAYITNVCKITLDIPKDNFSFYVNVDSYTTGTPTIDWGDGTSDTVTASSSTPHTYATNGIYTITLTNCRLVARTTKTYCVGINDGTALNNMPTSVSSNQQMLIDCIISAVGDGLLNAGGYTFGNCRRLRTVSTTSAYNIGNNLNVCYDLKFFCGAGGWSTLQFKNCINLNHVSVAADLTRIGDYAFLNCYSLKRITIPNAVSSIGDYAFQNCYSLSSITIPSSVTSIASQAFNGCSALKTITINAAEGAISGAPWGAPNATVVWTG